MWFGQIRDVEVNWRRSRLILHTSDGERQELKLDGPSLVALDSAIGAGLDSPPPAVLDQALWWILGSYERVVCAAFVWFCMGPILRCGADRAAPAHLVVVSDRRLIKVTNEWEKGEPLTGGQMTRRYLLLGQIRRIEVAIPCLPDDTALPPRPESENPHPEDGGKEMLRGGARSPSDASSRRFVRCSRVLAATPLRRPLPPCQPEPVSVRHLPGWRRSRAAK